MDWTFFRFKHRWSDSLLNISSFAALEPSFEGHCNENETWDASVRWNCAAASRTIIISVKKLQRCSGGRHWKGFVWRWDAPKCNGLRWCSLFKWPRHATTGGIFPIFRHANTFLSLRPEAKDRTAQKGPPEPVVGVFDEILSVSGQNLAGILLPCLGFWGRVYTGERGQSPAIQSTSAAAVAIMMALGENIM